jgi:hypothetical protein
MVDKSWCDKMAQVYLHYVEEYSFAAPPSPTWRMRMTMPRVVRSPVLANYQRDWRSGVLQGDDVCVETFVAALPNAV